MKFVLLLLVLVAGVSAADLSDAKNRPVSKVVNLLKDMGKQLAKEAADDEDVMDKMACWCTTNDKEKSASIAAGEQRSVELGASIEEGTAASARLNTEVKATDAEIAKNTRALEQATSLRRKELAEFVAEEKDMMQSISGLKSAVTVLGKTSGKAFLLQTEETAADSNEMMKVGVMLKSQLDTHADLLGEVITPTQKKAILAFADMEEGQKTAGKYAPQGGEVFGILNNMKETFQTNLAKSQQDESDNQSAYNDLKAAKESSIAAGEEMLQRKTTELGNTEEKLANDKQDLTDTTNSLAADRQFLAVVKEQCSTMDHEFELRQKARQVEIGACSKALAILSSDDAHDQFAGSFNAAFLQKAAVQGSATRDQAYAVLAKVAKRVQDPKLSAIAIQMRMAAFGKIKDTLEAMIGKLTKEGEDEIEHRDWCIDEMGQNEKNTALKDRDKEHLAAKIEDLASTADGLATEINKLKAEIAEMQVQLKRAGEDREMANKDFQATVADQRATQKLLTQALSVLKGAYDKKAALVQEYKTRVGQEPPVQFKKYAQNENSGGVMGMIQQIIDDAKAMETEAIKSEEDAQVAYEDFVKDSNNSIEQKTLDITNKSETKGQVETDKTEADISLEGVMGELQGLANESSDLHSSCDFVLKNFEIRQSARGDEIAALKQSIGILSGAKF